MNATVGRKGTAVHATNGMTTNCGTGSTRTGRTPALSPTNAPVTCSKPGCAPAPAPAPAAAEPVHTYRLIYRKNLRQGWVTKTITRTTTEAGMTRIIANMMRLSTIFQVISSERV